MIKISNKFYNDCDNYVLNNINIKEIDIYTYSSLEELQQQAFKDKMEYYVCVVREKERVYLFDAAGFIENCVLNKKIINNPITRNEIQDFEIFVSDKDNPQFRLCAKMKEILEHPNHLPILWTNTSKSLTVRLHLMLAFKKFYEATGNLQRTKDITERVVLWLNHSLDSVTLTVQEIFTCAYQLEDEQEYEKSFKAFISAAKKGNLIAVGEVINHLEEGLGIDKNPLEATLWRQKLPEEWRNKSIQDFFQHLQKLGYDLNKTGYP